MSKKPPSPPPPHFQWVLLFQPCGFPQPSLVAGIGPLCSQPREILPGLPDVAQPLVPANLLYQLVTLAALAVSALP